MPFEKVCSIENKKLVGRLYIHSSGKTVYSDGEQKEYLLKNVINIPLEEIDFFIANAWGFNENKMIDFFGYSGVNKNWFTNPEVNSYVLENGVWKIKSNISCGEGIIAMGEEEKFRRQTKSLDEYMTKGPELFSINDSLKFKQIKNN